MIQNSKNTQSSICCLPILALSNQEYPDNKQLSSHAYIQCSHDCQSGPHEKMNDNDIT